MKKVTRRKFIGATVVGAGTASLALNRASAKNTSDKKTSQLKIVVSIGFAADGELRQQILDPDIRAEMLRRQESPSVDARVQERLKAAAHNHAEGADGHEGSGRMSLGHDHDPIHNPNHVPIVLRGNDVVEWRCEPGATPFKFMIAVDRDPLFRVSAGSPTTPFGWELPQMGDGSHPIRADLPDEPELRKRIFDQMGYKFSAWAKGKSLDPCIICDTTL